MTEMIPGAERVTVAARTSALLEPFTLHQDDWVVLVLALTMLLTPALGMPSEYMLQDTLKSMLVSFGTLLAALLLFWLQRKRLNPMQWHGLILLPLMLVVYALGSMSWSHTYLGGVEAIRWFVFSLLLWVGMNTLTRERLPLLASGIHWGAVMASLWVALQFWADLKLFPQGAPPSSTFINRNFFAEFVVCTLPFSLLLLLSARSSAEIGLRAFFTAFNLVAILMTGTRSALLALIALGLVLPVIVLMYRRQFESVRWARNQKMLAVMVLLATTMGLGSLSSANPQLLADGLGSTALQRSFFRGASMTQKKEYTAGSASVRLAMWKATGRMIQAHPVTGVGAGAWEVDLPLFQVDGSGVETDFYVHNEILQLLAEYGLVGWLFLLSLLSYLSLAAWKTWRNQTGVGQQEAPLRALTLASLLAFLIVSCAGFPWHMASTGALFALGLAILAASDARLGLPGPFVAAALPWRPALARGLIIATLGGLALAAYISQQAAECERKIVHAVRLAATITQAGDPNSPRWEQTRTDILRLTREAIAINPHYRKITPMVGDMLARWGDWDDALWVWESVTESRPYIVAIWSNIARAHAQTGDYDEAMAALNKVKAIQPGATFWRSLEVVLLSRMGREAEAVQLTKGYFKDGFYDYELVDTAYLLGLRTQDWALAIEALRLRGKTWPALAADGWLKTGDIYASPQVRDEGQALQAYRSALTAAAASDKDKVRQAIPDRYRSRL